MSETAETRIGEAEGGAGSGRAASSSASPLGLILVVLSVASAAFALLVSGSASRFVLSILDPSARGPADDLWAVFRRDILGEPGLLVSAVKTVVAIGVATFVARRLRTVRGGVSLKLGPVEISGGQSQVVAWCIVFALVKLL